MRLFMILLIVLGTSAAHSGPDDETAIRDQISGYLDAWNRGDADALAEHVDLEGDRINARAVAVSGRDGIREFYRKVFSAPLPDGVERKLAYSDVTVRLVSADAAVVDAVYEVSGVGPDPELVVQGRNVVFMVKRDGVWLRAAHRNYVPTSVECIRRCNE